MSETNPHLEPVYFYPEGTGFKSRSFRPCASNDGEFYRFGWTPGDIESPRFRDSFVHGFGDTMNDKSATKVIEMVRSPRIPPPFSFDKVNDFEI